jgi:hypothetical protein
MHAQFVNARFTSSVYAWEKFDTVDVSQTILRGNQSLQMDVMQSDVSFHSFTNVAANLSNQFGDASTFRVGNLFVRWKNITPNHDVSVGRIPFFAGVGNGIVDGMLLKGSYNENYFATLYGGKNVPSSLYQRNSNDIRNNFLIGGQILTTYFHNTRIGLSYINRTMERKNYYAIRTDASLNGDTLLIKPGSRYQQLVGLDVRYDNNELYSGNIRVDYDMNATQLSRAQWNGRYKYDTQFAFTGDVQYRVPRIPYNSFFTMFEPEGILEYELGVEYMFSSGVRSFGKFALVQMEEENNNRVTFGVHTNYGGIAYAGTSGFAGTMSTLSAQCVSPLMERKVIPTFGITYSAYKFDENTKSENAVGLLLGGTVNPVQAFSCDIQMQYMKNKIFNNDVRLFIRLNYFFSGNLHFFDSTGGNQ